MYKNILTEINGRIAVITINRPEFANAINGDTVMEITDAVNTFGKDASVGSVVITGATVLKCSLRPSSSFRPKT